MGDKVATLSGAELTKLARSFINREKFREFTSDEHVRDFIRIFYFMLQVSSTEAKPGSFSHSFTMANKRGEMCESTVTVEIHSKRVQKQ